MKFRELFIAFALIGVFILCMVNFGIQISSDNNSNDSIMQDPVMNQTFEGLEANLSSFRGQAEGQREVFEADKPAVGTGFFILESILGAGRIFTGMVLGVFNLVLVPLSVLIGVSEVIVGIIGAILIVTILLLFWRVVKAGD